MGMNARDQISKSQVTQVRKKSTPGNITTLNSSVLYVLSVLLVLSVTFIPKVCLWRIHHCWRQLQRRCK